MFRPGKKFLSRDPPPPPPVKGKNFWHQIWLHTCSDWGKIFLSRDPCPSKGKNFWHQIWLHTYSDWGKKFFVKGPPPPPGIARNCYGHAAGGMPLAFTQEDFLVLNSFKYTSSYFFWNINFFKEFEKRSVRRRLSSFIPDTRHFKIQACTSVYLLYILFASVWPRPANDPDRLYLD